MPDKTQRQLEILLPLRTCISSEIAIESCLSSLRVLVPVFHGAPRSTRVKCFSFRSTLEFRPGSPQVPLSPIPNQNMGCLTIEPRYPVTHPPSRSVTPHRPLSLQGTPTCSPRSHPRRAPSRVILFERSIIRVSLEACFPLHKSTFLLFNPLAFFSVLRIHHHQLRDLGIGNVKTQAVSYKTLHKERRLLTLRSSYHKGECT